MCADELLQDFSESWCLASIVIFVAGRDAVIFVGVDFDRVSQDSQAVFGSGFFGFLKMAPKGRQSKRGKNSQNSNYYQNLNKGEGRS